MAIKKETYKYVNATHPAEGHSLFAPASSADVLYLLASGVRAKEC